MQPCSVTIETTEPSAEDLRTHRALVVLATALALGAVGDGMLWAMPWGLNLVFCATTLALAATTLAGLWGPERARVRAGIFAPALLLAAGCAWRDSAVLKALDFLGMSAALALAVWHAEGGRWIRATASDLIRVMWRVTVRTLFSAPWLVFADVTWTRLPGRLWQQTARCVIGGLIALPLLCVFGALFVSADAVFERLVLSLFDIDLCTVLSHVFCAVLLASFAGGYLRGLLLHPLPQTPPRLVDSSLRLGTTEIGVVLGCLNALFLTFIVVQFRYFFGGTDHVNLVSGLTYAAYARQGFFELVAVVALVLPVLVVADWLTRNETHKTVVRGLSGALVAMLFFIMASAFHRMQLYVCEYGLTETRLYATAFMGWLAVIGVWFGITVLRGRRERFMAGPMVAGCVALFALHAINPDALIIRINAARAAGGRAFDADYALSLSADAAPALLEVSPTLAPLEQEQVETVLRRRWLKEPGDWRNWSWACAAARRQVHEHVAPHSTGERTVTGESR